MQRGDGVSTGLGRAGMVKGSENLAVLTEPECWSRLEAHNLGRLAVVVAGAPRIFPINYAVGEGAIVFRTQPGAKLAHGPGSAVCFEIDAYEETSGSGWSVMAVGVLEDITNADDARSRRLRQLRVRPQAPGERAFWLALTPNEVTGRSFRVGWIPGHYLG